VRLLAFYARISFDLNLERVRGFHLQGSRAFEGHKMMKTIAGRIPIGLAGLLHTLGHHLSGGIFVV
jgi:hypothetical protein